MIVLTNPHAGGRTGGGATALREALASAGAEAEIREVHGGDVAEAARRAARDDQGGTIHALVAAGGDGTVSAVAAAVAGTPMPLGVIPTGTMNHFAKDLGLPLAVAPAARVVTAGHARSVDVAEVNDHLFINNSSIGLYPHIVGKRDSVRARLGRNKWVAMLMAFVSVFRRYPTLRVRIGVGDVSVLRTTPFVFVGNNRYEMNLTNLGRRQRLDAGELCVYFANRTGRFGLVRLAVRALFGRLEQAKDFDAMCVTELWIETPRKHLRVALDGEVVRLSPPLHYRIRPGALRVFAPPPQAPQTEEQSS